MTRTLSMPTAPRSYDRAEEQVFRQRIRQAVESALFREALFNPANNQPYFLGQPHAKMVGTNSALSVNASTITHLPLPTVSMTHGNLVASGEFKAVHAMDVEVAFNIYHSAAGTLASAPVTAYVSVWNGSTYPSDLFAELEDRDMTKLWGMHKVVMLSLTSGQMIRLRVQHVDSGANTFDLTKSWMTVKSLQTDPRAVESAT